MNVLFALTVIFYVASMLGYHGYVLFQKQTSYKVAKILLLIGFICHTLTIGVDCTNTGETPFRDLPHILLSLGWVLVGVFLALQIKYKLMVLGALASPLALLFVIASSLLPQEPVHLDPLVRGVWRTFHLGTLLIGNAAFAIACMLGIMYLVQEKAIKSKKQGFFFRRLPSLALLDSMEYTCLVAGFPLLTCGMVTGTIYAQIVRGSLWSWGTKEILGVITWLVYGALLHERLTTGWRRTRAAVMTILGFTIFLATFVLAFIT